MVFSESLNEYLDTVGLGSTFGQLFFTVMIIIFIVLALNLIDAPTPIIVISAIGLVIVATAFGFIPIWVILGIVMATVGLIYTNISGGARNA